jgi:hypothetical protein
MLSKLTYKMSNIIFKKLTINIINEKYPPRKQNC